MAPLIGIPNPADQRYAAVDPKFHLFASGSGETRTSEWARFLDRGGVSPESFSE